jgi:hypothetical protein
MNGTVVLDQPYPGSDGVRVVVRLLEIPTAESESPASDPTPAQILAEIAKIPLRDATVFSNREHDRVLYGPDGAR